MSNKKISEMDYKQLSADDQFPTVNASLPQENNYALGADIPLLVGISVWNSSATYAVGHLVIYNSSTVSGIFRVVTTTSAGDAPEGTGAAKFVSYALSWINTAHVDNDNISYERTGVLTVSLTGAATENFTINSSLVTSSTSHKVTATLFRTQAGGSSVSEDILIKSLGITSGSITFYIEKTTSGSLGSVKIAYTIEG
jgi:hypothetical protein